jgi:hypothetical protein
MATETMTRLVDDLDGGVADRTVRFTWSGASYELDLSKKNAAAFEKTMAPYIAAGRKVSARSAKPARAGRKTTGSGAVQRAEIRAWAQQSGYKIGDRGRIPADIIAAYEGAQ